MNTDKIIEIFISVDDFCLDFEQEIKKHLLESQSAPRRNRSSRLTDYEIITIQILFHFGSFRSFKHFYLYYVSRHMTVLFPNLVSYNRFIELQS